MNVNPEMCPLKKLTHTCFVLELSIFGLAEKILKF